MKLTNSCVLAHFTNTTERHGINSVHVFTSCIVQTHTWWMFVIFSERTAALTQGFHALCLHYICCLHWSLVVRTYTLNTMCTLFILCHMYRYTQTHYDRDCDIWGLSVVLHWCILTHFLSVCITAVKSVEIAQCMLTAHGTDWGGFMSETSIIKT